MIAASAASELAIRPLYARSLLWIAAYLGLILLPFAILLLGERPRGGGFAWDFALALGYAGFAMLAVQFWLTARFKRASAPFGIDILYYFHRYLALVAFVILLLHVSVLAWRPGAALGSLDPRQAPGYLSAGWIAMFGFAALLASSLWRKPLRLAYERWRRLHALLAVAAMGFAVWHIEGAGSYLQDPLKRALWSVLGLSWMALAAYVRLWRPWTLRRRPYRVEALRREAGRSWTLRLLSESGRRCDYRAGQFAWLSLRASPYALAEHPFSFSSCPADGAALEFTIKALGDFTAGIGTLRTGEIAYVDGPYGSFGVERYPDAVGYVFVAGGVGIAPIISLLRDRAARGERRPLRLFYGNRRWDRCVFRDELERLRARLDLVVVHVLTEPDANWPGERGFIDATVLARHLPANCHGWHAFVCGPMPMIRLVEHGLQRLGLPLGRVHSEIFELA